MASGDLPAFGVVLKRLRLAAGLTHEALAERAGLSARTISDLERGVADAPRRATVARLSAALALSREQLAILEAAARPVAPPGGSAPPPHNLPWQPTSFLGRGHEVRGLGELLRRPDTRLVTVTGSGGTGKTRLALRVAEDMLREFADGTFVVPLAPVADHGVVVQAIAQTFGLAKVAGYSLDDVVVDHLRPRRILLVLDNFEHLLTGAPLVAQLLGACPGLKALVTSRAALRLSGEWEFPLAPLPVPDARRVPSVEALAQCPSVALFVERAARVRAGFRLTGDDAAAVAEICRRLDGLPLALELAAARVKLLAPPALLRQLAGPGGSSLRLLTSGPRDLPARQQTLRGTIAWSYELLAPTEKRLFRRLAVFVDGCDLGAARAVCEGARAGPDDPRASKELGAGVLDGLASLVDQSLLRQEEGPDAEPRFAMLETIREFALELLTASGEAAAVGERHARYFLSMVEASGPVLLGAARDRLRLAAEQENIRAALRWLVEQG
ncbi:MAG TPA: helix-turn-helix domain-containing protein [Chloroflexota bacterium]|jgi:predicted ATPase/transcriptional regulator with XRE-family HTH domain